jgi:hypothetical protein
MQTQDCFIFVVKNVNLPELSRLYQDVIKQQREVKEERKECEKKHDQYFLFFKINFLPKIKYKK